MITMIAVYPLELGRCVMKSMDNWHQGLCRTGSAWSKPVGSSLGVLDWAETEQALTKVETSLRLGHQKELWTRLIVLWKPGCPELKEVWTHCLVLWRMSVRYVLFIRRASWWCGFILLSTLDLFHDVPTHLCYDDRWGQNGFYWMVVMLRAMSAW